MIGVDFKLFNHLEIPDAQGSSDAIILICENMYDGVGDFEHLKTYVGLLKEQLQDKSYKIQPIVAVHRYHPVTEEYQKARNARADHVENELKKMLKNGDVDSYILLNARNGSIDEELIKQDNQIADYLESAKAYFTISYKAVFQKWLEKLAQQGHKVVHCPQLASSNWNDASLGNVFKAAGIGLPRSDKLMKGKDVSYGLPIMPLVDEKKKVEYLQNLSTDTEMGNVLLSHMLCGKEKSVSNVEKYYQTHSVIPGYPQTKVAAINLVMVGALKNVNNRGELNQPIDVFLPKGIVDREFLQETLSQVLPNVSYEVITPQDAVSISQSETKNKVRIFSGFRLDDEHYNHFFQARNEIGMGSGDNSIIKAMSSDILPFFQDKVGSIRKFYVYQLIYIIEQLILSEMANKSETNISEGFILLKEYFQKTAQFVCAGPSSMTEQTGLFSVQNEPNGTDDYDFQALRAQANKYHLYLKQLAALAANPQVQQAWKIVSRHIQEHFNYRENFRGILNGALLLNNHDLEMRLKDGTIHTFEEWLSSLNVTHTETNADLLEISEIAKFSNIKTKRKAN